MAVRKGNFLKGVIGPVKFTKLNSQQILSLRPVPGAMKQTEATKMAASTFGMSSALSGCIRSVYEYQLDNTNDPLLANRLGTRILDCITPCRNTETGTYKFDRHSFRYLEGMEFNVESPLMRSLGFLPEVTYRDGLLNVKSPGVNDLLKIKYPDRTTGCDLTVSLALFRLADGKYKCHPKEQVLQLTIDDVGSGNLDMNFPVPDGCLCVISIFLLYYSVRGRFVRIFNTKDFSPAGICGSSLTPGFYQEEEQVTWIRNHQIKFIQDQTVM